MKLTTFNGWILGKIVNYLINNEGCIIERQYNTVNGIKAIVMDPMGSRYEIRVKSLDQPGVENEFFDAHDFVVFPKTQASTKHE